MDYLHELTVKDKLCGEIMRLPRQMFWESNYIKSSGTPTSLDESVLYLCLICSVFESDVIYLSELSFKV